MWMKRGEKKNKSQKEYFSSTKKYLIWNKNHNFYQHFACLVQQNVHSLLAQLKLMRNQRRPLLSPVLPCCENLFKHGTLSSRPSFAWCGAVMCAVWWRVQISIITHNTEEKKHPRQHEIWSNERIPPIHRLMLNKKSSSHLFLCIQRSESCAVCVVSSFTESSLIPHTVAMINFHSFI